MKTTNCTLTLAELAAGIRDGDIVCYAVDIDLWVDALADRDGPDCYPDTTLEFSRDGDVVASVGCWVLGQYMRGPNRRDNGVYIGQGWQWQRDESDGQSTGRPRATKPRNGDTTVTFDTLGSSLQALTLAFSPDAESDDILADIEVIQDAIDDAYADISVGGADDDDVTSLFRHVEGEARQGWLNPPPVASAATTAPASIRLFISKSPPR